MQNALYRNIAWYLCYSTFATLIYFFLGATFPFNFYEVTWIGLLFVQVISIFYFQRHVMFGPIERPNLKDNLDLLVVFAFILIARLLMFDVISVWLDEEVQAFSVMHFYPVQAGALQHQPPLDMLFTKLGLLVGNTSIWGLRMHAVIFSSLAATLLYWLLKNISKSMLVAFVLTLYFSFHRYTVQFGFEARPISLGLYSEVLFLGLMFCALRKEQINFAFLSCGTFLYLSSLGMQPVYVVVISLLFLLVLVGFDRSYFKSFLSVLIGFLLFLPLQIVILFNSPPRIVGISEFSLTRFLEQFTLQNFSFLSLYFIPWGVIAAVSFLAVLFYQLKDKKWVPELTQLFYCGFVIVIFSGFSIAFFKSHIAWGLQEYYLISVLPLLFVAVAVAFSVIKEKKYLKKVIFILLSLIFVGSYNWANFAILNQRENIKDAYKFLKNQKQPSDLVLSLCLGPVNWASASLRGSVFYNDDPNLSMASKLDSMFKNSGEIYSTALIAKKEMNAIYFLYYADLSDLSLKLDGDISEEKLRNLKIFKIKSDKNDMAGAVIEFMKPIVDQAAQNKVIYVQAIDYLVRSYEYKNDLKNVEKYVKLYKENKKESSSEYLDAKVTLL